MHHWVKLGVESRCKFRFMLLHKNIVLTWYIVLTLIEIFFRDYPPWMKLSTWINWLYFAQLSSSTVQLNMHPWMILSTTCSVSNLTCLYICMEIHQPIRFISIRSILIILIMSRVLLNICRILSMKCPFELFFFGGVELVISNLKSSLVL